MSNGQSSSLLQDMYGSHISSLLHWYPISAFANSTVQLQKIMLCFLAMRNKIKIAR
jgi:hypothetical protein